MVKGEVEQFESLIDAGLGSKLVYYCTASPHQRECGACGPAARRFRASFYFFGWEARAGVAAACYSHNKIGVGNIITS